MTDPELLQARMQKWRLDGQPVRTLDDARAFLESVRTSLKRGQPVTLVGFGTFSVSQRKARNGRNPQTGATIKIAARRVAKFSPGAELKKSVNKK